MAKCKDFCECNGWPNAYKNCKKCGEPMLAKQMANDKHTAEDEKAAEAYAIVRDDASDSWWEVRLALEEAFLAGIAHEREKAAKLVEACTQLVRELNDGQEIQPGGPEHFFIERILAAYKGATDGK